MSEWHTAPDGRRFRVYEQRCLHSCCWAASCECGHKLTAHDFDAEGATACALDALSRTDPLNRRDFAHPPFQCSLKRTVRRRTHAPSVPPEAQ